MKTVLKLAVAVLPISFDAACFFDDTADGATILCSTSHQCPSAQRCDVEHHVCVKPGADVTAPVAADARFSPATAASGVVTLTIDADEPIGASPSPPALTFAGGVDPGFAFAAGAGTKTVTFTKDVADVAEGFYAVTAVTLTDALGNTATSPVSATLAVDRTPPAVAILGVAGGDANGVLADEAPNDHVVVTFSVSEPLAADPAVGIDFPAVVFTCPPPSGLTYACSGDIAPGHVAQRDASLTITAVDAAGNATTASRALVVDVDAPFVVDGSVHVDVDGAVKEAAPGSVIDLEFLASEPLSATPVVVLDGAQQIPFHLVASEGSFYAFRADVVDVLAEGTFGVTATLVDAFGHQATAPLPLPESFAAGIALVAFPQSPCPLSPVCPDVDGDGFFGATPACPPTANTDCDDRDPLTYPGAPEVYGDGKQNDCAAGGGEGLLDESVAVFLAPNGDDTTGDGTRSRPLATLALASSRANATGKIVAAAAGTYANGAAATLSTSLIGGLDPTFASPAGTSRFPSSIDLAQAPSPYVVVRTSAPFDSVSGNATVVDTELDHLGPVPVNATARFVRISVTGGLSVLASAPGTRFIASELGPATPSDLVEIVSAAAGVVVDNSVVTGLVSVLDGDLTIVNSAVASTTDPAVSVTGGSFALEFSTVTAPSVDLRFGNSSPAAALLSSSIFAFSSGNTSTSIEESDSAVFLQARNNAFSPGPAGSLLFGNGPGFTTAPVVSADATGLGGLNACTGLPGCVDAGGNVLAAIPLSDVGRRVAGNVSTTAAYHAAAIPAEFVASALAAEAVADEDGECRYVTGDSGEQPNLGPDQTP